MKKPFRYVIYLIVGFLIFQIVDSGETNVTHQDARNWLIGAIVVVFVLMIIIGVIKQRHEK